VRSRVGLGLAVGALLVGACSSGDDDGGSGGAGGGIAERLESLPAPAGDDPPLVVFGDLDQAADLAGVSLSDDQSDDEAIDAVLAITGGPVKRKASPVAALTPDAAHVDRLAGSLDEFRDEVGWSVADVDSFVEYQIPPKNVTVMAGDFDEDRLSDVLGKPDDGVWVVGDPDGDLQIDETSPARPLGEPLWLSLVDGRLVVARSEKAMDAVRSGDGATLADDSVLRSLAEALDGEDVYSAMLTGAVLADPIVAPTQCDAFLPQPFGGVAAAIADDDGPVVVLAYVHADADSAKANAEALRKLVEDGESLASRRPWSDYLEVDDIGTDANILVARLRVTEDSRAGIWRQLLLQRDNLVAFCA
jgi:hypothetical protein